MEEMNRRAVKELREMLTAQQKLGAQWVKITSCFRLLGIKMLNRGVLKINVKSNDGIALCLQQCSSILSRPVKGENKFNWCLQKFFTLTDWFIWMSSIVCGKLFRNRFVFPLLWFVIGWKISCHILNQLEGKAITNRGLLACVFPRFFAWYQLHLGYLPFTWGNRKFRLETEKVA